MADYQRTLGDAIIDTRTGALLYPSDDDPQYQAYQAWVAGGGVADPVPAEPATGGPYRPILERSNDVWQFVWEAVMNPAEAAALILGRWMAAGLTVTSAGTPALNGVFSIDAEAQGDIAGEAQYISTFQEFTSGGTTNLPWVRQDGSIAIFPTLASFLQFARKAAQRIGAAKVAVAQGAAMPDHSIDLL